MNSAQDTTEDEPLRRASPQERFDVVATRRTPTGFEQRLLARAKGAGLARGDGVVVAFSGGRDSLALAAALRWARDAIGLRLLLAHVDHRLRARSGDEAARAAAMADELGLALRVLSVEREPRRVHPGVGCEEAARRERYRLLYEVAIAAGARAVATGHHEQDQAETVLLHLLRGAGVRGAAGMAERARLPVGRAADHDISQELSEPWLWRPVLPESRQAIDAYVAELGIPWIEDPSNADLGLRRNLVRRAILPRMEAAWPGAAAALARHAALAAADDAALDDLARAALAGKVDPGGRLPAAALRGQPLGLRRRMARLWFAGVAAGGQLSAERTDAVLGLADAGRGGRAIEAGEGWTVTFEGGMLSARRAREEGGGER